MAWLSSSLLLAAREESCLLVLEGGDSAREPPARDLTGRPPPLSRLLHRRLLIGLFSSVLCLSLRRGGAAWLSSDPSRFDPCPGRSESWRAVSVNFPDPWLFLLPLEPPPPRESWAQSSLRVLPDVCGTSRLSSPRDPRELLLSPLPLPRPRSLPELPGVALIGVEVMGSDSSEQIRIHVCASPLPKKFLRAGRHAVFALKPLIIMMCAG